MVRRSLKIVPLAAALVGAIAWLGDRYLLKPFPGALQAPLLKPSIADGKTDLRTPGRPLIGLLASYEDELFAYLMFDYLRSRTAFSQSEVLLTYSQRGGRLSYPIYVVLPDDLLAGSERLYGFGQEFPFLAPEPFFAERSVLERFRSQTQTFVRAYNFPAYRELEQLSKAEVVDYARRFIRMKSNTDPRIRRRIEPIPAALTRDDAEQLAEDIVTVAQFFDLPLEFFLGIGAMENNYMNVQGDLDHTIWKRRAEKGDVIVRRGKNRVLVRNESSGVWQITRETLRYAHRLYLRDPRDYSQLPPELRPARDLDVGTVDPRVLTTYAAILFRELLDRFDGDVSTAVGAYNGGAGNPNANYEAGVRVVAEYARRVMEQASGLRLKHVVQQEPARTEAVFPPVVQEAGILDRLQAVFNTRH